MSGKFHSQSGPCSTNELIRDVTLMPGKAHVRERSQPGAPCKFNGLSSVQP